MAGDQERFEHESIPDRESIVRYLAALAEGIEKGKLLLSSNGSSLSLEAPALVRLDVEAKQEWSQSMLLFRIRWKRPESTKHLCVDPLHIAAPQDASES